MQPVMARREQPGPVTPIVGRHVMRECVIWCVVLLATTGTAFGKEPKPAEQAKATQEAGAGWKALDDEATALPKKGRYDQAVVAEKGLADCRASPRSGSSGHGRQPEQPGGAVPSPRQVRRGRAAL